MEEWSAAMSLNSSPSQRDNVSPITRFTRRGDCEAMSVKARVRRECGEGAVAARARLRRSGSQGARGALLFMFYAALRACLLSVPRSPERRPSGFGTARAMPQRSRPKLRQLFYDLETRFLHRSTAAQGP